MRGQRELFAVYLPPHPLFLRKSAEAHERKRVELRSFAKKCKRVHKGMKRKVIVDGVSDLGTAGRRTKHGTPYIPRHFA
jgi:hypothetical protein